MNSKANVTLRIAAFIFPVCVLVFPSVRYWRGRVSNLIPTRAEWESVDHSSGPWQAEVGFLFIGLFLFACLAHVFAVITLLQLRQRKAAAIWAVGGVLGLVSTAISLHLFGYLID